MKKNLLFLTMVLISIFAFSQTPQSFKYQAVARNLNGDPLINQGISVKTSILSGSPEGSVVYSELHELPTNQMGLFTIEIGNPGLVLFGSFPAIEWGACTHFLKLEINENGGLNFQLMGVSQLLSVPYALYAKTAGNGFSGNYNDLSNKPITDGSETKVTAGTNVIVTGTGTDAIPYVVNSIAGFTHKIGEIYGGGIVFHVYKDENGNEHGLVASLTDLSTSTPWGLYGINVPNCESSWNGQANTNAILAAGCLPTDAAGICNAYISNGFTDWYLPAIDELNLLYNSQFIVNKTLSTLAGASEIVPRWYWSSSEYDPNKPAVFDFNSGSSVGQFYVYPKTAPYYVRAVRAF